MIAAMKGCHQKAHCMKKLANMRHMATAHIVTITPGTIVRSVLVVYAYPVRAVVTAAVIPELKTTLLAVY
jgi:hypothetical protein